MSAGLMYLGKMSVGLMVFNQKTWKSVINMKILLDVRYCLKWTFVQLIIETLAQTIDSF